MGNDSWVDDVKERVGREDEEVNSGGRQTDSEDRGDDGSSWIDGVLEKEAWTDVEGGTIQNPKAAQGPRLTVPIARTQCVSCGSTAVRGRHPGCDAPIIYISDEWRCSLCGDRAPPDATCPNCGSSVERNPIDVPLDFTPTASPEAIERAIHEATNKRRADHGRQTLDYSHHLSAIAVQHSRDMAERDFFDHTSPDGHEAKDRYRKFGHDTRSVGENIALENPDLTASPEEVARSIVDGWMNSDGHRENLLRESFRAEGIGVHLDPNGAVYATQNFY
ncbi:CAP domain-containing protein [Halosimplex sp. TS25]|uniref:CAP domain-containing protein n=1 Tax=Halosimplex rarum TaxID=3396619 RepID=UPI0039E7476D